MSTRKDKIISFVLLTITALCFCAALIGLAQMPV